MSIYSFWLSANRSWKPDFSQIPDGFSGTYFRNQAIAMLHGQLSVPEFQFANECFYRDDKCYGYFGIFPSLVRLPFFLLFQTTRLSLAPVSIAIAAGIGLWAALDMLRRLLDSPDRQGFSAQDRIRILLVTALLIGGGGSFVTLSQAKVYREAIIWMASLILVAFSMSLRWMHTPENKYLIITLIAAVGATNSRPSAIPVMAGLGIWIYVHHHTRGSSLTIDFTSLPFAIIALPALSAFAVFYLKFRALTPPWSIYAAYNDEAIQRYIRLNDGTLQGLRYLPTNLAQYFRPDSIRYNLGSPWAHVLVPNEKPPILVRPIVGGGMYFEPTASITNTMPLQLALTAGVAGISLIGRKFSRYVDVQASRVLLFLAALTPFFMLTAFGNTSRYIGDFFPLLVVGTIFGEVALFTWLDERKMLRPALAALTLIAAYFAFVQFALNIEGWDIVG